MKNIIIALFSGLFLASCAFSESGPPSMENIQSKNLIKEINKLQVNSNMSPTKTPETSYDSTIPEDNMFLPGTEIFAFSEREPDWYTIDDNVMGGVSSSTVEITETGLLSFSGNMSLENNGGFSSARSEWYMVNLTSADGVLLRVLGDGKMYRLRIHSESTGSNIAYNATFETTPENWNLVYIPFSNMIPTYFGSVVDVGRLDTRYISSFGFMLSDKQPGEFALQVDWIRAISEQDLPILGRN